MKGKTSKNNKTITWEYVWEKILLSEIDSDELNRLYNECTDSKENYRYFYKCYLKDDSAKGDVIYTNAGYLWKYLDAVSKDRREGNNQIADVLLQLLERNKKYLAKKRDPFLKYKFLDVCCDIFIAHDKREALTYIAILYDLLVELYVEAEEEDEFYTSDVLEYLIASAKQKWFHPNRLSNDPEENIIYLKEALSSPKVYIRSFASLLAVDLLEQSKAMPEKKKNKRIDKGSMIFFGIGLGLGIGVSAIVGALGNKAEKTDIPKVDTQMIGSETPTPTPTVTITEILSPTETPTPTPTETPEATPESTESQVIGNNPEETSEETNESDAGIRLNTMGRLNVDKRFVRLKPEEGSETDPYVLREEEVFVVAIEKEDEDPDSDACWYEVRCASISQQAGVKYYMWLQAGDLVYD